MGREYQFGYSEKQANVFNVEFREKKAKTIVSILSSFYKKPLKDLDVLDVGASTGIIGNYLSRYVNQMVGVDIDFTAIKHASETYQKNNLCFYLADGMKLPFLNKKFDVVICAHVYEHVPDAKKLLEEIFRVLKPGGVCYFAAGNRLMWNEPHYNLPLLSVLPRPLAHLYIRLTGKADFYHEKHLSYWGLRELVKDYNCQDYTVQIVTDPLKFKIDYMLVPGSLKAKIAKIILSNFYWLSPGYIWLLTKPE